MGSKCFDEGKEKRYTEARVLSQDGRDIVGVYDWIGFFVMTLCAMPSVLCGFLVIRNYRRISRNLENSAIPARRSIGVGGRIPVSLPTGRQAQLVWITLKSRPSN